MHIGPYFARDVILFQCSERDRTEMVRGLESFGYTEHIDFVALTDCREVENRIYNISRPQLLVTDNFTDDLEETARIIGDMKRKNPNLVVVAHSSIPDFGRDFAKIILRKGDGKSLHGALFNFRSGRLSP